MPSPDDIFSGLTAIANKAMGLALACHVVIAALLVPLAAGCSESESPAGELSDTPPPRGREPVYIGGTDGGVHVVCRCNADVLSCQVKHHPGDTSWTGWSPRDATGDCLRVRERVYGSSYFDPWDATFVSSDGERIRGAWEEPH